MLAELARVAEITRLASLQQASMTPQALQLSRHARRVYVGNLPPNVTEASITHYFNQVSACRENYSSSRPRSCRTLSCWLEWLINWTG